MFVAAAQSVKRWLVSQSVDWQRQKDLYIFSNQVNIWVRVWAAAPSPRHCQSWTDASGPLAQIISLTAVLLTLKYAALVPDAAAVPTTYISMTATMRNMLLFGARMEMRAIAKQRQHDPPAGCAKDGDGDAHAKDACSLGLAMLATSPPGLYVLVPGWVCITLASVCSYVLQTSAAAKVLDMVVNIFFAVWVILIYVRLPWFIMGAYRIEF